MQILLFLLLVGQKPRLQILKENKENPFLLFETMSLVLCLQDFPCKRASR